MVSKNTLHLCALAMLFPRRYYPWLFHTVLTPAEALAYQSALHGEREDQTYVESPLRAVSQLLGPDNIEQLRNLLGSSARELIPVFRGGGSRLRSTSSPRAPKSKMKKLSNQSTYFRDQVAYEKAYFEVQDFLENSGIHLDPGAFVKLFKELFIERMTWLGHPLTCIGSRGALHFKWLHIPGLVDCVLDKERLRMHRKNPIGFSANADKKTEGIRQGFLKREIRRREEAKAAPTQEST